MADPFTWIAIGSTVLSTASTIIDTNAAKAQAGAEAKVADYNAEIAGQQAGVAEDAQRRKAREFLARQRAAIGQAGIGLTGSSITLANQSATEAELDALNIRYEGTLRRTGFLNDAAAARARRKAAGRSGYLRAGAQLLAGASSAYGSYKSYRDSQPLSEIKPTGTRIGGY